MKQICTVCKKLKEMSKEHVCPVWLIKSARSFGIKEANDKYYLKIYGEKNKNIVKICLDCNQKKGSTLNLKDAYTLLLLKQIQSKIKSILGNK